MRIDGLHPNKRLCRKCTGFGKTLLGKDCDVCAKTGVIPAPEVQPNIPHLYPDKTFDEVIAEVQPTEVEDDNPPEVELVPNLLETAWNIIANAGGGDWDKETEEWQKAVYRWREDYFNWRKYGQDKTEIADLSKDEPERDLDQMVNDIFWDYRREHLYCVNDCLSQSDHNGEVSAKKVVALIADREAKAVAEALKGQVFNEVTISEKVHIPKQLLAEIERKAAVEALKKLLHTEIDTCWKHSPDDYMMSHPQQFLDEVDALIAQYERGE